MKLVLLSIVGLFVFGGAVGNAHHSYGEFQDQAASLEGTLEKIEFANPHTILTVRAKDGSLHTAIWFAAFQPQSMGVSATSLKVGDQIQLIGTPAKDSSRRQVARLSEVRRASDGWRWLRNDQGRGPSVTAASH